MLVTPTVCAVVGAVLPFSPLANVLGFTALPLSFFLILIGMILAYLVLIEIAKVHFYSTRIHPTRTVPTHEQRREHHIRRRADRFTHHHGPRAAAATRQA